MTFSFPLRLVSPLALALLLSHCDDGSAARIKSLRDEIDQMNKQSFDASQQVKRLQLQIESAKEEKQQLETEKAEAEKATVETKNKLEQLQRDFDTYKSSYKLSMQKRAPGMKIDDFTTPEGKSFRHIVLRELTDTYVNFTHEAGIIKLSAAQLPESMQALLGFLNNRFEEPKDVKAPTVRQGNLLRQAAHGLRLEEMEASIKALRNEKEQLMRRNSEMNSQIRERINNGGTGSTAMKRAVEQGELQIQKVANQILQAEVEMHSLRRNTPVNERE